MPRETPLETMILDAILLTMLGGLAAGAILGGIAVIAVDHVVSSNPVPDVLLGSVVFGAGALAILAVAIRAARRAYRGEVQSAPLRWLAYALPALIAVGVGVGGTFMYRVVNEHQTHQLEQARSLCEAVLDRSATAAVRDQCLDRAQRCMRTVRENPPVVSRGVPSLTAPSTDPSESDVPPRTAAERRCLRAALGR